MVLERHLGWMAEQGTTTAEVKSGYGLDRDTELAMLEAASLPHRIETVPTFLGAHAVGPEWDDADAYLDFVIGEVLPAAAPAAEAADVFLERGAFDRTQAARYLRAAAELGPRCGCMPISSRRVVGWSLRSGFAPGRSTTSRPPAREALRRCATATWPRCCCPPAC
jgi:hypothetical protein